MKEADDQLKDLADYLWGQKNRILENWESKIRENSQFNTLSALSRKEFLNDVPNFLFHLKKKLRNEKHQIERFSKKHGAQRWKVRLNLCDVAEEWGILHDVLIDEVCNAQNKIEIDTNSVITAQKKIAEAIHKGIQQSVSEYHKAHRVEAQSKITDMETVLRDHSEEKKIQGHNLRQASHDLGGSVALIQMNLNLLKNQKLPKEADEIVKQLSGSAENLTKLFKSLLDLFRLEAGDEERNITDFDAGDMLKTLCDNMRPLAVENKLEIHTKGEDPFPVQGDMIKVRRIAQNLVMNSLKYTEKGYVEISWQSEPDNHWSLTVRDTGPGLDATQAASFSRRGETPAKIEPQTEAEESKEMKMHSEGIGLSIVRRLCQLLDAVVEVDSVPGKGTSFKITFPAKYPDHAS